ncbi:MAG: PIN domain-containing protein [Planctomycetes bacterium]|nr:PIN domain-containing protein [Planctomycetota bacterium]
MFVLDTDTLTFLLRGQERVTQRTRAAPQDVVITVISRIETLLGRFASILKAEDGERLLLAQQRLVESERDLGGLTLLPVDAAAAAAFDRLRQNKKLKKIGRGDLLIAAITLANAATLVTRNLKDFRQVPSLPVENWVD